MSSTTTTTTTTTPLDPAITSILTFWFQDLTHKDWFQDSAKHDPTITTRFSHLVDQAINTTTLDETWTATPSGSLALILLLDQFTRNIYRAGNHENPGLSFSGDAKALRVAARSVARGFDRDIQAEYASGPHLGKMHRYFLYMPFMHAEDLPSQIASVALAEVMAGECEVLRSQRAAEGGEESEEERRVRKWLVGNSLPFARKHRDCVARLGRFPKRNGALGRDETEEERRFLEEHPMGF